MESVLQEESEKPSGEDRRKSGRAKEGAGGKREKQRQKEIANTSLR